MNKGCTVQVRVCVCVCVLFYFSSHNNHKQQQQHADKESSLDYPNTFKVKGRRFELIFAAKSALEEQAWIDCIRNVIKASRSY